MNVIRNFSGELKTESMVTQVYEISAITLKKKKSKIVQKIKLEKICCTISVLCSFSENNIPKY